MAGYKRNRYGDAWELIVTLGTDFSGKPKRFRRTVHCASEKEADRELARFYVECEEGSVGSSGVMTIAGLADKYMVNYSLRYHKISSQRSDRTAINNWIVPYLGRKKLNKLKKLDVQEWVNFIVDQGKSPKTVRNYFSVLRSMMDFAIDMDLITTNPCVNVRMPSKARKESRSYDRDQLASMLRALDELPASELKYKCCILLALFGGFRKGEILGFNWSDVDFETCTMSVVRTRMIGPGNGVYEDTPKTEKSSRQVVVPSFVIAALNQLKVQQFEQSFEWKQAYAHSPAMIRSEDGRPLYPQVLQRWFTRFCNKNGLPAHGLHALRHTHASLLASLGADKVLVSSRLGHSQVSTTLNIYTHLFENVDNTIASQLESFAADLIK